MNGRLRQFIIEPFVRHDDNDEYYLSIFSELESDVILFHHQGGVDVGDVEEKVTLSGRKYLLFIFIIHGFFLKKHGSLNQLQTALQESPVEVHANEMYTLSCHEWLI